MNEPERAEEADGNRERSRDSCEGGRRPRWITSARIGRWRVGSTGEHELECGRVQDEWSTSYNIGGSCIVAPAIGRNTLIRIMAAAMASVLTLSARMTCGCLVEIELAVEAASLCLLSTPVTLLGVFLQCLAKDILIGYLITNIKT